MTPTPRILFVSRFFPRDEQHVQGVYKRQSMWIEALSRVGQLRFLFYVDEGVDASDRAIGDHAERLGRRWDLPVSLSLCPYPSPEPRSRWEAYGAPTLGFHRQGIYRVLSGPSQVAALERELDAEPDLVFAHRLQAMAPILRSEREPERVLLDLDDVEHLARFRSIGQPPHWPGKKFEYLQLPALWLGERRALRSARRSFACSERDRRYLERQGLRRLDVVPNAVRIPDSVSDPTGRTLLFLGIYSYRANLNAARRLALEIWPLVQTRVPDATLVIAGGDDELVGDDVRSLPGVEVTGFVEDLDELYARTRVVSCPIREGGGTRIKILEAAAYGRPVVSTAVGAEGLAFRDGEEILVRDGTAAFADACVELLLNDDRAAAIGRAARTACAERYERSRIVEGMTRTLREELASGG